VTNINEPRFDEPREHPGFRCRLARLSRQAGSERLGLSLWELPAGEAAYPFHHHLTEEELVVVLEGAPSLRTPEGWRELVEGEVVAFTAGKITLVSSTTRPHPVVTLCGRGEASRCFRALHARRSR
jgi:uncharacterized cupin superfamily protein